MVPALQQPATAAPQPAAATWTTPRILVAAQAALWAGAFLFLVTALYATSQHRSAVQTIGKDSAPSIIAAEHIKSALSDMDANAVNELIAPPFKNAEAIKDFEARRWSSRTT